MGGVSAYRRVFRVEPYGWKLRLFTDRAKWARHCAKLGGEPFAGLLSQASEAVGMTDWNAEHCECVVGVFDGDLATLAHEMTHAAIAILNNAGVKFAATNSEPLAYLVGYLTGECAGSIQPKARW